MDISNISALFLGIMVNVGGFALRELGIEVAAWPLLIFSILGFVFILIKNYQDTKHATGKNKPLPKKTHAYDISDDCIWEDNPGWYRNPITDELFCGDCWDGFKIKKHLIKKDLSEWFCPKCKKPYNSRARMWKNLFMKKPIPYRIRQQPEK